MKETGQLSRQLSELGITATHRQQCRIPPQQESTDLVSAEVDIYERPQQMTGRTLACWQQMRSAAQQDDIKLLLVSAYRSIPYQCALIRRKLDAGENLDQILRVNAIPGYSEHHTGAALDLTTTDCKTLDESFDTTPAFLWLTANASQYDFFLSYPKDNALGITYEPWHWACRTG